MKTVSAGTNVNEADWSETPRSRLLHRLAVLAVCLVWPLIWIGGLVTTYDAGMAVPDWPNTYGYNLFLYPYKTWLLGPFDLFIEHGHRLLGAIVGMVAIAIAVVAYLKEPRRWVFALSLGLLAAVIAQGVLGGLRVVLGDRTLAMVHGCTGPLFFALCVVMAAVTGRWWSLRKAECGATERDGGQIRSGTSQRPTGMVLVGLGAVVATSYGQLLLGAQLRHAQPNAAPSFFVIMVMLHVMTAFLLLFLALLAWGGLRRCGDLTLSRPAAGLIGLVTVQLMLGLGTWVVNYGWPSFLHWIPGSAGFLLRAKGFVDSVIVTAHVATGSLILGVATLALLRLLRDRACRGQTA